MIKKILGNNSKLTWSLFHIVLGFAATQSPWFIIVWFYTVAVFSIGRATKLVQNGQLGLFLGLVAYLLGFELVARMAKTYPWVPFETGKYFLLGAGVFLYIGSKTRAYWKGLLMFAILLPAAFIDLSDMTDFSHIVFNLFGPLGMALGIGVLYNKQITENEFNQLLKAIWLPILASSSYLFIKTPDLDTIEFTLHAQSTTTAGHATNQVSTILGLGVFLSAYSWLNRLNFSGFRQTDALVTMLMTFQGLISFSRGGIIVGILAIIMYISITSFTGFESKKGKRSRYFLNIVLVTFGLLFTFRVTDKITDGKLLLRFQGESEGTLIGSKEKDLAHITTGRTVILLQDIDLWLDHPIFGVGVGASMYLRGGGEEVLASHLEPSRLLAEHGLFGLLFIFFLIQTGANVWVKNKNNRYRAILATLYFIGFATTLHAGMRTFVTPLLISLCVLKLRDN
jgi:hypothetical protein